MKKVENCDNTKCRYCKKGKCSLDEVLENFRANAEQCATGGDITTMILSELERGGECPRFM